MDEYRENVKRIQKALNQDAAFIQPNPYLAQRVLNAAHKEGGNRMYQKRKLSVGAIVTLVLILISLTAVAAVILSGRDMVEQHLIPMSQKTDSDTWTPEEMQQVMAIAQENGVAMTEAILDEIDAADPVYKEELMRLFMKMDLGEFPASWPLEDQAWYDELLFTYGLVEERTRFVPGDGELMQEEAISVAIQYAKDSWGIDLNDTSAYKMYVQYMLSVNSEGQEDRVWDVEFEHQNGNTYVVCITKTGEVVLEPFSTYIHTPEKANEDTPVTSALTSDILELAALMRDDEFYEVYTLARFKDNYGKMIEAVDDQSSSEIQLMLHLLNIPYAMPKGTDIKPDATLSIAKEWALDNGWVDEWLGWCKYSSSYRVYEGEKPIYRVCFKLKSSNRALFYQREMPFGFVVYIDPTTGDVIRSITLNELDDFDRYCEFPDPHDTVSNPGNG